MSGVSRIYRLLRLVTMLQGRRGHTAAELAEELSVSRRTIFRDLNMLEMARIPYYFEEAEGGYRISRHFFLPPVNLTFTEALAVLVVTGRVRGGSHVPLMNEAARAAMKLENALPEAVSRHVGPLAERLHVMPAPASRHDGLDETFDQLLEAIGERRVCRLVYVSFHEKRQLTVTVRPLRLVFVTRAWYLIGWSSRERAMRTYKLGRIVSLRVTEKTFTEPADVDLEAYFGDAWNMIPEGRTHDVRLRFARKVAGNVAEVRWHRSQQLTFLDDGSVEMAVRVDGLGEITWWILGYGDQVEVLAPQALRDRVAGVARAVVNIYSNREVPA